MSLPPDTEFPLDDDDGESLVLSKMEALLKRHRPGGLEAPVLTDEARPAGISDYPVLMDPDAPAFALPPPEAGWFDPDGPILDLDNIPTDDPPLLLDIDDFPEFPRQERAVPAPAPQALHDSLTDVPAIEVVSDPAPPQATPLTIALPPTPAEALPPTESLVTDAPVAQVPEPAASVPVAASAEDHADVSPAQVVPTPLDIPTPALADQPRILEDDVPVLTELALEYDDHHPVFPDHETREAWIAEMVEDIIRELTPKITGLVRAQLGLQIGSLMKTVTERVTLQLQEVWRRDLQQSIEQRIVEEISQRSSPLAHLDAPDTARDQAPSDHIG